jgi:hypothetical protein
MLPRVDYRYSVNPQQEFWKRIEDSYEGTKGKKRNKHFLSTNRSIHNHRLILALLFEKFNLFEKSYVTFPPKNPNWEMELGRGGILQELTSKYNITKNDILSFESKLPLGTEEYETDKSIFYGKELSYMNAVTNVNSPIWDTYFQLVTLTDYFNGGSAFNITRYVDKLWKIVATFQPFIVFGTPYSLETLRERGFKTFGKWIDESYDDIYDDIDRFDKTIKLILELSKMSLDKIHEMYLDMSEVLIYNFKRYNELINDTELLKFKDEYIDNPYIKLPVVN